MPGSAAMPGTKKSWGHVTTTTRKVAPKREYTNLSGLKDQGWRGSDVRRILIDGAPKVCCVRGPTKPAGMKPQRARRISEPSRHPGTRGSRLVGSSASGAPVLCAEYSVQDGVGPPLRTSDGEMLEGGHFEELRSPPGRSMWWEVWHRGKTGTVHDREDGFH